LNRFLGSRAVAVLNHWFQSNRDYPYPDDERTDRLAREAGKLKSINYQSLYSSLIDKVLLKNKLKNGLLINVYVVKCVINHYIALEK
jgi:hypothetical protein